MSQHTVNLNICKWGTSNVVVTFSHFTIVLNSTRFSFKKFVIVFKYKDPNHIDIRIP